MKHEALSPQIHDFTLTPHPRPQQLTGGLEDDGFLNPRLWLGRGIESMDEGCPAASLFAGAVGLISGTGLSSAGWSGLIPLTSSLSSDVARDARRDTYMCPSRRQARKTLLLGI